MVIKFTVLVLHTFLTLSPCLIPSVPYGAARGEFSLVRPRPYTGPGGYVSGNPRPAPVRGPPAIIPWTGPRLLPPILNGDPSGVWVGRGPERGQGQGIPKKTPRPRALSGAGRGKGPGARVFQGPVRPVTNSTDTSPFHSLPPAPFSFFMKTFLHINYLRLIEIRHNIIHYIMLPASNRPLVDETVYICKRHFLEYEQYMGN